MKSSNYFTNIIQTHLNDLAANDELFAKTLKKENKNIDDCINYILTEVQKSGINGFVDEEVFQMAVHYYDEDDIKVGKAVNAKIVVNHSVEKVKTKATDQIQEKVIVTKSKVIKLDPSNQVSLFDFDGV